MNVEHIEVLTEEPSMEAFLRGLLPRMLGGVSFDVHPYQGKQDLLKHLPYRLRGYSRWLPSSWRIMVIVDRDNADCRELKERLEQAARDSGLATRSAPMLTQYKVVNRLAIEELEAWYFGDWTAVRNAYPQVSETIPEQARYRDPDRIAGGTWEAFERILQRAGYFKGGLPKIEVARTIGGHTDPRVNTSRSFQVFRDAVRDILQAGV
jgi:hypothetical protein